MSLRCWRTGINETEPLPWLTPSKKETIAGLLYLSLSTPLKNLLTPKIHQKFYAVHNKLIRTASSKSKIGTHTIRKSSSRNDFDVLLDFEGFIIYLLTGKFQSSKTPIGHTYYLSPPQKPSSESLKKWMKEEKPPRGCESHTLKEAFAD